MSNKPTTIDECMVALTKVLSKEDIAKFLKMSADDLGSYHHGLGQWIRNNWGLWELEPEKSPLLKHMIDLGFKHPDDMSQSIIVEFWNRLNNQPSTLQEDIKEYAEFWNNISNEQ